MFEKTRGRVEGGKQIGRKLLIGAGAVALAVLIARAGLASRKDAPEQPASPAPDRPSASVPNTPRPSPGGRLALLEDGAVLQNNPDNSRTYCGTLNDPEQVRIIRSGDEWSMVTPVDGAFDLRKPPFTDECNAAVAVLTEKLTPQ